MSAYDDYYALMDRVEAGEDLGPRYSGDGSATYMKWPDVFLDLIPLAHRWRQLDPAATFATAQRVIARYPDGFDTREQLQEFLDCFDDPRKNKKRSRCIPKRNRERILARGQCERCGSTEDLSVDHIRPFSSGGSHHISNLQCLCKPCNSAKGARTMEEWLGD